MGTEGNNYSVTNLLNIYQSFLQCNTWINKKKLVDKIVELTYECIKSNDEDLLSLFKLFHINGVLEQNEKLVHYFQHYAELKFATLPKDGLILEYSEFLKDLGLWHWNTTLIDLLKTNFEVSMLSYNEGTTCRLIKLIAYNHKKDEEFL